MLVVLVDGAALSALSHGAFDPPTQASSTVMDLLGAICVPRFTSIWVLAASLQPRPWSECLDAGDRSCRVVDYELSFCSPWGSPVLAYTHAVFAISYLLGGFPSFSINAAMIASRSFSGMRLPRRLSRFSICSHSNRRCAGMLAAASVKPAR